MRAPAAGLVAVGVSQYDPWPSGTATTQREDPRERNTRILDICIYIYIYIYIHTYKCTTGEGKKQSDPVRSDPVRSGPVKDGPVRDDPTRDGPTRDGPAEKQSSREAIQQRSNPPEGSGKGAGRSSRGAGPVEEWPSRRAAQRTAETNSPGRSEGRGGGFSERGLSGGG